MKKLLMLLIVFSLELFLTQKVFASDKTTLVRDISDNAWEITRLVKTNLSSSEVENFYTELKNATSSENANTIIINYLGSSNANLFNIYLGKIATAGHQLESSNLTFQEFEDLLQKAYIPKDDENAAPCKSWAGYNNCSMNCNGPAVWGKYAFKIFLSTVGMAGTGAQIGSWLTPITGGSSMAVGTLVGGLYGFYEGFSDVNENYGDCLQKCFDYHCLGKDTGLKGKGGGLPGGGWTGEDKTAE